MPLHAAAKPPKTSIQPSSAAGALRRLERANRAFLKAFPGDSGERQAVHTVYGGAQLFKFDTAGKLGFLALKALKEYAPSPPVLGKVLGLNGELAEKVYGRVAAKLGSEPVEDFRIDFEDGFGVRPDAEEDFHAERTALETAKGMAEGTLPPFFGIRIKPMSRELHRRSLRTLDVYATALASKTGGRLTQGFVVTVPKVTIPEHVEAASAACALLEKALRLSPGALRLELMIETPQSVLGPGGGAALRRLVDAGGGRVGSAHFGTYDYTALVDVTAAHQHMAHPACDFAKHVMQVALAQTGIRLSDGATNIMPVGSPEAVHRAWRLHYDHVRHSLIHAYYQGWDLHPAQLPTRYAAVYAFFLEGLEAASTRLRNFVEKAAQATLVGDVFDDAATGQGLLNYFLRGMSCGAITMDEAKATGLSVEQFRARSFLKILKNNPG